MSSSALRKLKPRRRRFVELYLGSCKFNASEAARQAGFSEKARAETGYFLLRNAQIKAAVAERLEAMSMSAEEATVRLTRWGRGEITPFQRITADGSVVIDLATSEAQANLDLVRELKVHELRHYDADGKLEAVEARTEIKLHDAKDACVQIAKIRGLYAERDPDGNVLPPTINVNFVVPGTVQAGAAPVAPPVVRALLNGGNGNGNGHP